MGNGANRIGRSSADPLFSPVLGDCGSTVETPAVTFGPIDVVGDQRHEAVKILSVVGVVRAPELLGVHV